MCEGYIKPDARGMSWCQAMKNKGASYIGKATHFASHAWKYNFDEFLGALIEMEATEDKPEEIFLWLGESYGTPTDLLP